MTHPLGLNRWVQYSAVTLLAVGMAACDESVTETPFARSAPQMAVVLPTQAQQQAFVCAAGPTGSYAFTVSESDPTNIATLGASPFNLAQDACTQVATTAAPGGTFGTNAAITVTSTGMPANVVLDSITKHVALFGSSSSPTPSSVVTTQNPGPANTFDLGLEIGVVLVFNFSAVPTGGGEGCTPGYWKQSQHFGNWTGYTPGQLFSSVFSDAFPGMTLLQVLGQGGGGLKALGRHTVAALLNAASGGVDSGYTTAEVIAAFNAAYASGSYDALHAEFAAANEQGCPLGRAE